MKKPKTHLILLIRSLSFLFLFLLIGGGTFAFFGIKASEHIEVNHYTIKTRLTDSIRIVHITDLHNAEMGKDNKDLVAAIKKEKPDLIFTTGDMINREDPDLTIIIHLIEQLKDIAPVYYGYGNHEVTWEELQGQSMKQALSDAGATVLQDTYIDMDFKGNHLRIGGVMNYYRAWGMMTSDHTIWDMEQAFAEDFETTNRYKILLNHIPTSFTDWGRQDEYPVDLVFSGHYHGGTIRIPILDKAVYAPYIGLFPPYTKGVTYGQKAICVQSAGIGNEHGIPRMFNPPEVTVVDLVCM